MSGVGTPRHGAAWAAKRVLFHSGLLALARQLRQRDRAVILRYHAITDGTDVEYAAPDICLPVSALNPRYVDHFGADANRHAA